MLNTGVVSNLANVSSVGDDSFVAEFLLRRLVVDPADETTATSVTVNAYYNGGGSPYWTYTLNVVGTADASAWDVPAVNNSAE